MFYAKSNPIKSIGKHTNDILESYQCIYSLYHEKIDENSNIEHTLMWKTLYLACLYHDIGKCNTSFQNKIIENIGGMKKENKLPLVNIRHEMISPMFIPNIKTILPDEYATILIQTIFYHHNHYDTLVDNNIIRELINVDIEPLIDELEIELQSEIKDEISIEHHLKTLYLKRVGLLNRIEDSVGNKRESYLPYVLVKGLLHRLDYAASADVTVEETSHTPIGWMTKKYIENNFKHNNVLQDFCKENYEQNMIIVASTGFGKTEASLLWANNDKTFFTLPFIVSINAIYERIKEKIQYEKVGLLHSQSLEYLSQKEEDSELLYEQATYFALPTIVCTIDQLFSFVFKFKGYERIYATLSYSKIIIDEIQSYSPHIVAVILRGIVMIYRIGGKFMIMTATLPNIYKEYLKKEGIPFKEATFLTQKRRHVLEVKDKELIEEIDEIVKLGENNKVLIIVNTVNKAIELYQKIQEDFKDVSILHARFLKKDKRDKEQEIIEFSNSQKNGIWITTQIVEASLDISFDYLFTELSTLDSLVQRMGRCYRNQEYTKKQANIYVYTKGVTGIGSIYDKEIFEKSKEAIEHYHHKEITEREKTSMVEELYSEENLKETTFLKEFKSSILQLENITYSELSKKEAQKMLRNIENIKVIPRGIYDTISDIIEDWKNEKDIARKRKLKREIEDCTLSILKRQAFPFLGEKTALGDIYIVDLPYSNQIGLIIPRDKKLDVEERMY